MIRTTLLAAATLTALAGAAAANIATDPTLVEAQIAVPGLDFSGLTDRQLTEIRIALSSETSSEVVSAIRSIVAQ